jgi:hypothetical protein
MSHRAVKTGKPEVGAAKAGRAERRAVREKVKESMLKECERVGLGM